MRTLIFALLSFICQQALATTMVPLSLNQLTKSADLIVRVTIENKTSAWDNQRIYTYSQAKVTETLKDKNPLRPKTITIKSLGGVVGDIGQQVHGSPHLITGKEYILFLIEPEPGTYFVFGMEQGVVALSKDEDGKINATPGHHELTGKPTIRVNELKNNILGLVGNVSK